MKFTLAFNLLSAGWAECILQRDGEKYEIDGISYLSDAFLSLSTGIKNILKDCTAQKVWLDHEPGRTGLLLTKDVPDEIELRAYWFEETLKEQELNKSKCDYFTYCSPARLRHQIIEEMDKHIMSGTDNFVEKWGYPFPMEVYREIKAIAD